MLSASSIPEQSRRVDLHPAHSLVTGTPENVAAREDVIAVFVYRICDAADCGHMCIERHGDTVAAWHEVASLFAAAALAANVGDGLVMMRLNEAQALRYIRSAHHAIVAVTVHGSAYHKTLCRTLRGILRRLDRKTDVKP